jgi:hypothetical protein
LWRCARQYTPEYSTDKANLMRPQSARTRGWFYNRYRTPNWGSGSDNARRAGGTEVASRAAVSGNDTGRSLHDLWAGLDAARLLDVLREDR